MWHSKKYILSFFPISTGNCWRERVEMNAILKVSMSWEWVVLFRCLVQFIYICLTVPFSRKFQIVGTSTILLWVESTIILLHFWIFCRNWWFLIKNYMVETSFIWRCSGWGIFCLESATIITSWLKCSVLWFCWKTKFRKRIMFMWESLRRIYWGL